MDKLMKWVLRFFTGTTFIISFFIVGINIPSIFAGLFMWSIALSILGLGKIGRGVKILLFIDDKG